SARSTPWYMVSIPAGLLTCTVCLGSFAKSSAERTVTFPDSLTSVSEPEPFFTAEPFAEIDSSTAVPVKQATAETTKAIPSARGTVGDKPFIAILLKRATWSTEYEEMD